MTSKKSSEYLPVDRQADRELLCGDNIVEVVGIFENQIGLITISIDIHMPLTPGSNGQLM